MIINEYANEEHIVHELIRYTHNNKLHLPSGSSLHFFVWGYEFWLPEGGKSGYTGSIDLIATDNNGNVWLVEAKQSANPELNANIWENQILKYRWALSRRSHDEISMKSRRFLLNGGKATGIVPPFIHKDCHSLFQAFVNWSKYLGKDKDFARQIYNSTINNIKNETVISTVLADVFRRDVWESRPRDNKPYAYIISKGTGSQYKIQVVFDPGLVIHDQLKDYSAMVKDWGDISQEKKQVKPRF